MSFGDLFGTPFDLGRSLTSFNGVWDCAINGIPFRMDRESDAFKQGMQTIAAIREQSDNSALPGEQSISREELWRAGQASWHKGAGQRYRDKADSDPERFWASQGINPWTRDQIALLHGTTQNETMASTKPLLLTAGDWIYYADNDTIARSSDGGVNWTGLVLPGSPGTPITSMATDGYRIWICTTGLTYKTNIDTATITTWLAAPSTPYSGFYELVAYANGRLIVTNDQFIAEVSGTGTVTVLNPDEANIGWQWTAITDGTSAIYVAGYSGNRSQIYSIRPPTDDPSATLGAPIPAAPMLPSEEIVRSLYSYLGLLCVGTDKGIRVASKITDYAGREIVSIGQLIALPHPVLCMDGDGQYVYFGWTNFSATVTGLGRLNLAQGVDNGVYAYASDLMAANQGSVTSTAAINDKRFFAVATKAIYVESSSYVTSGWLDSGVIRYSLIDDKVAQRVEVKHESLTGAVGVSLSADGGDFVDLGTNNTPGSVAPSVTFSGQQISGVNFNVKTTLTSASGTPVVQHVELRSSVVPSRGETFLIPLLLDERDTDYVARHPSDDFEYIRGLARTKHLATYQEKSKIFNIIVLDYQFARDQHTTDKKWWNGTCVLKVMSPAQ